MFATQRQLRYGTTIIYDGKVGKIASISKGDSVKIKIGDSSLDVKKKNLTAVPHDEKDIIEYKNSYYKINSIEICKNVPKYKLFCLNKIQNTKNTNQLMITSTDPNIISIEKKDQDKIREFIKFLEKYNSTIRYLVNKTSTPGFEFIDDSNIKLMFHKLIKICHLKITTLYNIDHVLKKTQDVSLKISFIYENPFHFIRPLFQLITFEKAEQICEYFKLNIPFDVKLEKWTYDFFLKKNNSFYIEKNKYLNEMKKFCDKKEKNYNEFIADINKILIDKIIDNTCYKTTNDYLTLEKDMTDKMIKLFNHQKYDIDQERINALINEYEEKRNRERIGGVEFKLEQEQRLCVINSIINKFSIIIGPPGTGKTEITKCIEYVLYKLYKTEKSNQGSFYDSSDDEDDIDDEHDNDEKYVNPKTIGLIAPTGKAFNNMKASQQAKHYNNDISGTCHRLLYYTYKQIVKHKEKCNCCTSDYSSDDDSTTEEKKKCKYKHLKIKLMIVDETSMLDIFLFNDILEVCESFNSRLILICDINQLPSIGPGIVLKKLIDSKLFTVTELKTIKRQNAGALVNCIKEMTKGEYISNADFTDDSISMINPSLFVKDGNLNVEYFKEFIETNHLDANNSKFITCFNKETFDFNTYSLNNLLQDIYNPVQEEYENYLIYSYNKYEKFQFRIHDKIIRTENDYSDKTMRSNGDEAEILEYDGKTVTIKYSGPSDKPETIDVTSLYDNFILNYVITVHKSQGSQYSKVIFMIDQNQNLTDKNTIYTAISRAKEKCIVVSNNDKFIKLQSPKNDGSDNKISLFMEESDIYEL